MTPYEEVISILRSEEYGWPVGISPSPDATEKQLLTDEPAAVAQALENYCHTYTTPPYGYPGSAYEWARYALFNEGVEYWDENTQIALGQIVPVPLDKVAEAKTVSEWWNAQDHNRNRLGFKLWDENDADSVAWHEKLFAAANEVPPEWTVGTDPLIYQLACREGLIQPNVAGFGAAYASQTPRFADVRGLTAQQWLDNLRGLDAGLGRDEKHPLPWAPIKPLSKVPA